MNNLQIILLLVALLSFPESIPAGWKHQPSNIYRTGNQQTEISQQKAIAIAQQHIKGRVLDIKRSDQIYRVKILSNQGSVHIVRISVIDGTIKKNH